VPECAGHHPLQYWYERRFTQPELATFAFDCLARPLISDDPERSFSAGRGLITYRRSNLEGDIIKAFICLRSWYDHHQQKGRQVSGNQIHLMTKRQSRRPTTSVIVTQLMQQRVVIKYPKLRAAVASYKAVNKGNNNDYTKAPASSFLIQ